MFIRIVSSNMIGLSSQTIWQKASNVDRFEFNKITLESSFLNFKFAEIRNKAYDRG